MILNCGNHPLPDLESSHFFPYSYRAKLISCRLQSCYSMLVGGTWRAIAMQARTQAFCATDVHTAILFLFTSFRRRAKHTILLSLSLSMLLRCCCCLSSKRYTKLSVRHSTTEILVSSRFFFYLIQPARKILTK